MSRGAGNHGFSAAAKSLVVAVIAAATLAQFFALSHEVTVRHFRCAEHGELTHVAPLVATTVEFPSQPTNDAFRGRDSEAVDAHEHCGAAFTVEGSSCTPSVGAPISAAPPPAVGPVLDRPDLSGWSCVLASAPKTSPPAAA